MREMDRERGSLVSYIVVGVLLVLILVSGLYGVQRYRDSQQEVAKNDGSSQQDNSKSSKPDDSKSTEPKNSSSAPKREEKNSPSKQPSPQSSESDQRARDLPVTGPVDTVMNSFALGVITFAAVAFIRSRQTVAR